MQEIRCQLTCFVRKDILFTRSCRERGCLLLFELLTLEGGHHDEKQRVRCTLLCIPSIYIRKLKLNER